MPWKRICLMRLSRVLKRFNSSFKPRLSPTSLSLATKVNRIFSCLSSETHFEVGKSGSSVCKIGFDLSAAAGTRNGERARRKLLTRRVPADGRRGEVGGGIAMVPSACAGRFWASETAPNTGITYAEPNKNAQKMLVYRAISCQS
jgi:hypothetical protein